MEAGKEKRKEKGKSRNMSRMEERTSPPLIVPGGGEYRSYHGEL